MRQLFAAPGASADSHYSVTFLGSPSNAGGPLVGQRPLFSQEIDTNLTVFRWVRSTAKWRTISLEAHPMANRDVDDRVRYIATALNLATIGWSDDTFDWSHSTLGVPAVKQNYHNILDAQGNGSFDTRGTVRLDVSLRY